VKQKRLTLLSLIGEKMQVHEQRSFGNPLVPKAGRSFTGIYPKAPN